MLRKLVRSNIYFNVLMTRIFILTLLPTQIIFSFLWCTDSPNAAFSHKREFLFEKKPCTAPLPSEPYGFSFSHACPLIHTVKNNLNYLIMIQCVYTISISVHFVDFTKVVILYCTCKNHFNFIYRKHYKFAMAYWPWPQPKQSTRESW